MHAPDDDRAGDEALGMDAPITRRDFLGSTLLASGEALLPQRTPAKMLQNTATDKFTGFGGVGDYSSSNGNTRDVVLAGHEMRDGVFDRAQADDVDPGEVYDCVVVGGGIRDSPRQWSS